MTTYTTPSGATVELSPAMEDFLTGAGVHNGLATARALTKRELFDYEAWEITDAGKHVASQITAARTTEDDPMTTPMSHIGADGATPSADPTAPVNQGRAALVTTLADGSYRISIYTGIPTDVYLAATLVESQVDTARFGLSDLPARYELLARSDFSTLPDPEPAEIRAAADEALTRFGWTRGGSDRNGWIDDTRRYFAPVTFTPDGAPAPDDDDPTDADIAARLNSDDTSRILQLADVGGSGTLSAFVSPSYDRLAQLGLVLRTPGLVALSTAGVRHAARLRARLA